MDVKEVVAVDGGARQVVYKDGTRESFEEHRARTATPRKPEPVPEKKPESKPEQVPSAPAKSAAGGKRWAR